MDRPFSISGATVNVVVTATSDRVALPSLGETDRQVLLTNIGAQTVFIATGGSTVVTTLTSGKPLLPNSDNVFSVGPTHTHVAAIASAVGNTLFATSGFGS